jgi:hypothetical protein
MSSSSSGSQFFSFLKTKDHFSSSCRRVVWGGKAHEFVVSRPGVIPGQPAQAHDGVAVDADEALGLADAAAVVEVGEQGAGLVLIEPGGEQGRALAFGEAPLAELAVEQAALVRPVACPDRDVAGAALAVTFAPGVEAAEAIQVVHVRLGWRASVDSRPSR